MAQKRSLFRYYAEQKWADAFVDGRMRFWSLSYFRDREDKGVRGDANEGKGIFAPEGGLEITNHTQSTRFSDAGARDDLASGMRRHLRVLRQQHVLGPVVG